MDALRGFLSRRASGGLVLLDAVSARAGQGGGLVGASQVGAGGGRDGGIVGVGDLPQLLLGGHRTGRIITGEPAAELVDRADADTGIAAVEAGGQILGQRSRDDGDPGRAAGQHDRPFAARQPPLRGLASTAGQDIAVGEVVRLVHADVPVAASIGSPGPQPFDQARSEH